MNAEVWRRNGVSRVLRCLRCLFVFASLFTPRLSHAGPACGQRPWIAVEFLETGWPAHFRETVLADLRASSTERHIDVCSSNETSIRRPAARITLSSPNSTTVLIVVVANDEKARKRVSRTVSLLGVPSDGQPFAVALATDELLQASWSELALVPPEVETRPAPPPTSELTPPPPPLPVVVSPPSNSLTAAALLDLFLGKQGYGGGELRLRRTLSDDLRWSVEGGLGGSLGRKLQTEHGSVTSHALLGSGWLRYGVRVMGNLQLGVGVGTRVGYHTFTGKAAPTLDGDTSAVTSRSVAGWVGSVMGRLDTRWLLGGPLYCDLGLELGFPLRNLQITDSGDIVTGAAGLRVTSSAGAGLRW